MKPKYFALIVGNSGSGKTTIVEELKKRYGLRAVESYTTRQPRYDGETGHKFVTTYDIPSVEDMVGYTCYNGNFYWATQNDVVTNDLYVIDVPGINFFKEHYNGEKPYVVIQIYAPESVCMQRMLDRGDSKKHANERIQYDKTAFKDIEADIVFENKDLDKCVKEIAHYLFGGEIDDL